MKFHYRFSNLLGTVYRGGNLCFTGDGDTVAAAVGNKISLYDLKRHTSETLPVEARSVLPMLDGKRPLHFRKKCY